MRYTPSQTLTSAEVDITSDADLTAVFNWYFFPGWKGSLDGQPVELRPVGEHGLIGVDVPAGEHRVRVYFGNTPLRRRAVILSSTSVGILILTLTLAPFASPHRKEKVNENGSYTFLSLLLILALFTFKQIYLDQHPSPLRHTRFDGQRVEGVQTPLQVNFGDQMELLGYDIASSTVQADGLLDVTLYWRALQPHLDTDYSVALHMVDEQGRLYGQKDSQHPAGHPTSRWSTDRYARDVHRLAPWLGTPPGVYTLQVAVYDVETGRRLDVRNAAGAPIGTYHPIATVQVTRPTQPFNPTEIDIARRWQTNGADEIPALAKANASGVRLLGFDPPPTHVDAGGRLPFTLYWQATDAPPDEYTVRISLAAPPDASEDPDPQPAVVARELAPPGRASYPTSAWHAGDIVRQGHTFLVPADTPTGEYGLYVDLLDSAGRPVTVSSQASQTPVPLIGVNVRAPERRFDPPPAHQPLSPTIAFDNLATLIGYDLDAVNVSPTDPLTVTLHWRAQRTAERSYVVFVHLVAEGQIIAQSDQAPNQGARPTTGWLPGEFIADTHVLTLPSETEPGRYTLVIGLYDPATDQRLPVLDEHKQANLGDYLTLTKIQIGEQN
jgi:hypothetical protein